MPELARGAVVRLVDGDGAPCGTAVVAQSSAFAALPSVLICPLTYETVDAPLLRIEVSDSRDCGLPGPAWIMVELLTAVLSDRIGVVLGHVGGAVLRDLDRSMLAVLDIV